MPEEGHELTAAEYASAKEKMCRTSECCADCPIGQTAAVFWHVRTDNVSAAHCMDYIETCPDKAVDIVKQWKGKHIR